MHRRRPAARDRRGAAPARAASSRSRNGTWPPSACGAPRRGSNHSTRSISGNDRMTPERGGHSRSKVLLTAVAGRGRPRLPSRPRACPTSGGSGRGRSAGRPGGLFLVSSSNSRRATATAPHLVPPNLGIVHAPGPRPRTARPDGRGAPRGGGGLRRTGGRLVRPVLSFVTHHRPGLDDPPALPAEEEAATASVRAGRPVEPRRAGQAARRDVCRTSAP